MSVSPSQWTASGPQCMQELTGSTEITNNAEFRTQSIRYNVAAPSAVEIGIEVDFAFSDSSQGCPGQLQFFLHPDTLVGTPVTPAIGCDSNSPRTVYFSVSGLNGQDTFSIITQALLDMNSAYNVSITQLRVHVQQCPTAINGLATYPLSVSGATEDGTCVANSALAGGSTLSATCGRDGLYNVSTAGGCECIAGYQLNSDACEGMCVRMQYTVSGVYSKL